MSGAEVVGIMSSAITLGDTAMRVMNKVTNICHEPQVFVDVRNRLSHLQDILQSLKTSADKWDDIDYNALFKERVQQYEGTVARLKAVVEDAEKTLTEKGIQVFLRDFWRSPALQASELTAKLTEDLHLLLEHEQINEIISAREFRKHFATVRQMLEEGRNISHSGSGNLNINHGPSTHNTSFGTKISSTGSGRQYVAQTMSFAREE